MRGNNHNKPRQVILQPRDLELLECVYDTHVLDTRHALALVGGKYFSERKDPTAIFRKLSLRMAELSQAGYLAELPQEVFSVNALGRRYGRKPKVYRLTRKGEALFNGGSDTAPSERKHQYLQVETVEHARSVASVYTALRVALRLVPNVKIANWQQGGDLRRTFFTEEKSSGEHELVGQGLSYDEGRQKGYTPRSVAPDAHFLFVRSDTKRQIPVCLECDRDSMSNRRFAKKIEAYLLFERLLKQDRYYRLGFLVLTVCETRFGTDGRKHLEGLLSITHEVLKKLNAVDQAQRFRFCVIDDFSSDPKQIPRPIWQFPGGGAKRLRPYE